MDYTYELKRVPIKEDMPRYISSQGGLMTNIITPRSYINFKIEEKMKKLDNRMANYINRYKRERRKLQDERHDTSTKYKTVKWFELLHLFTPEEREEFKRLYDESMDKLRLSSGLKLSKDIQ